MKLQGLILLLLSGIAVSAFAGARVSLVKYVFDGDTVLMASGEKVRYIGIDAPEVGHQEKKSEFMARAARDFNDHLVGKKLVRLQLDRTKRDRHGRLLAYVFLENGAMVNGLLLQNGLARVMAKRPNLKHFAFLLQWQRAAMKEGLGIWSKDSGATEKHYPGSSRSYRFHRPQCAFTGRIHAKNLVKFTSPYDACWEGFSPCKRCNP